MNSINISFIDIFLTALGTFAVFNFKEAIKEARKKKLILTRLNSYLTHWSIKSFDESESLNKFAEFGHLWFIRYQKCKTNQEILDIDKEIETKFVDIKKQFIEEEIPTKVIEGLRTNLKNYFDNDVASIVEKIEGFRKDIISGSLFPSDTELSQLGNYMALKSISVKLEIISFLEDIIMFIKFINKNEDKESNDKTVVNLFFKWIKINRDKMVLVSNTKQELSKGTMIMALEIFFNVER